MPPKTNETGFINKRITGLIKILIIIQTIWHFPELHDSLQGDGSRCMMNSK